ncbi:MAG: branched-chain amino acid ABC transporter permease [Candidatus Bathyarchaeia archaeon]
MEIAIVLQALINGLMMAGLYMVIGMGFGIVYGVGEIVNLAHGDLVMISMYIVFWIYSLYRWDPFIISPLIACIMFGVGVLVYFYFRPLMKKQSSSFTYFVVTMALSIILQNLAQIIWSANYRSILTSYALTSISIGNINIPTVLFITFIISLNIILLLSVFLKFTDLGRAIRAVSQNEQLAYIVGINVDRIRCFSIGISSALAGIAGCCVITFSYVYPTIGSNWLITCFQLVVLSGMGNFWGIPLAALILSEVYCFTTLFLPLYFGPIISAIIFLLMLIIKPQGLLTRD